MTGFRETGKVKSYRGIRGWVGICKLWDLAYVEQEKSCVGGWL